MSVFSSICLCTMHVPGDCRGQDGMSEPLELELQMVMHCHVGAGNQTQTLQEQVLLKYNTGYIFFFSLFHSLIACSFSCTSWSVSVYC